jgi:hypothetical protein
VKATASLELRQIQKAVAGAREIVWAAAPPGDITIDFDATLVTAFSDKQDARPTYKKGFGFHPLGAWCDTTGEPLGAMLRPGNAGSNDADDQHAFAARGRHIGQGPTPLRREVAEEALDRVDRDRTVEFSTITPALAGVVTDPPVDRRQRIVGDEGTPGQFVVAMLDVRQPRLDVLAGGTAGVAGRQKVDVDRTTAPDGSSPGVRMDQVRQRREISRSHAAARRRVDLSVGAKRTGLRTRSRRRSARAWPGS